MHLPFSSLMQTAVWYFLLRFNHSAGHNSTLGDFLGGPGKGPFFQCWSMADPTFLVTKSWSTSLGFELIDHHGCACFRLGILCVGDFRMTDYPAGLSMEGARDGLKAPSTRLNGQLPDHGCCATAVHSAWPLPSWGFSTLTMIRHDCFCNLNTPDFKLLSSKVVC